jgi:hypothetical protein
MISNDSFVDENVWSSPLSYEKITTDSIPTYGNEYDIKTDLSSIFTNVEMNKQDSVYILTNQSSYDFTVIRCEYNPIESNEYMLPRFNLLNLSKYYNKTNCLVYSYDDSNKQPSVYIYNPIKNVINSYETICNDVIKKTESHQMTFYDIFKSFEDFDSYINTDVFEGEEYGVLKNNVYVYDECHMTSYMKALFDKLSLMNIDDLLDEVYDKFGDNAYPLRFKDTEWAFTEEMLINYIMQNSYDSPIYKKDDIHLLRKSGEIIYNIDRGSYVPEGEQPTGGYDIISSEVFNPRNIINDNTLVESNALFIFRLDDNSIESLTGFRLFDDNDNDISNESLLILNNNKYVFSTYKDDWVSIVK